MSCVVIKVGGSLFDWPDLPNRLRAFLCQYEPSDVRLVPGGGPMADVVRSWDHIHSLGDDAAHWLAIESLDINAALLRRLVPGYEVISPYAFCLEDERPPDRLPHNWEVTSDAIAARIAVVLGSRELILLKSTNVDGERLEDLAAAGVVDPWVARIVRPSALQIKCINLRLWRPPVPPA